MFTIEYFYSQLITFANIAHQIRNSNWFNISADLVFFILIFFQCRNNLALIVAVSFTPVRFIKPDRCKNIAESRKMDGRKSPNHSLQLFIK